MRIYTKQNSIFSISFQCCSDDPLQDALRERETNPDRLSQNLRARFENDPQKGYLIKYDIPLDWKTSTTVERCFRELKKSSAGEHSTLELSFNPRMKAERDRMAHQAEMDVKKQPRPLCVDTNYETLLL